MFDATYCFLIISWNLFGSTFAMATAKHVVKRK